MRDRVSTKILDNGASRYGVYDETGDLLRYEYIKLEDEPSTEGDFFNKANMLPDHIPALLGLKMGNPQVKDALNVLANVGNLHVWERVRDGVTDYLTSTDRNAYPDSATDGQDAYYTLGDESQNVMIAGENYLSYANCALFYSDSVSVNDIGDVSLNNPSSAVYKMSEWPSNFGILAGKFVRDQDNPSTIYYLPADVSIINNSGLVATKSQRVTGHAAIPANTAITYLGQLGNRTRIETGSYVGTRTYGSSNPNTLTFGFEPKIVFVVGRVFLNTSNTKTQLGVFNMLALTDEYLKAGYFEYDTNNSSSPSGSKYAKKNGNTLSWYSNDSTSQLNGTWSGEVSIYTYFAFA